MKPIEIPFSESKTDQVNLGLSGGCITFKANDEIVYQFATQDQYNKFLELKNQNR